MYKHSEGPGKHFVYRCLSDIGCSVILSEFTVLSKPDARNWHGVYLALTLWCVDVKHLFNLSTHVYVYAFHKNNLCLSNNNWSKNNGIK